MTENLRATWRNDRAQSLEEREHTQSGRPRSLADQELVDIDIAILDRLLRLPLRATFDARDIQAQFHATYRPRVIYPNGIRPAGTPYHHRTYSVGGLAWCENYLEDQDRPCTGVIDYQAGDAEAACLSCGGRCGYVVAYYVDPVDPSA